MTYSCWFTMFFRCSHAKARLLASYSTGNVIKLKSVPKLKSTTPATAKLYFLFSQFMIYYIRFLLRADYFWRCFTGFLQHDFCIIIPFFTIFIHTQCLKITEKVSFNIASEASYVYILSGQKFIKNAKNGQFWRVFENLKLAVKQCYQTGHF